MFNDKFVCDDKIAVIRLAIPRGWNDNALMWTTSNVFLLEHPNPVPQKVFGQIMENLDSVGRIKVISPRLYIVTQFAG